MSISTFSFLPSTSVFHSSFLSFHASCSFPPRLRFYLLYRPKPTTEEVFESSSSGSAHLTLLRHETSDGKLFPEPLAFLCGCSLSSFPVPSLIFSVWHLSLFLEISFNSVHAVSCLSFLVLVVPSASVPGGTAQPEHFLHHTKASPFGITLFHNIMFIQIRFSPCFQFGGWKYFSDDLELHISLWSSCNEFYFWSHAIPCDVS